MKSLVEEASSIAKAIEKAWERAGKPQSFSVKVYEASEKNFFGFTKKSAKVGIFFEEEVQKKAHDRGHSRSNQPRPAQNNQRHEQSSDRDNRQNGRRDDDRKARHQSNNQSSRNDSDGRSEGNYRERGQEERSESRGNRPHQADGKRRPQQQHDRPRREQRPADRPGYDQPIVSSLPFVEENEVTPITTTNVVSTPAPVAQPTPQISPIAQPQRKVLKVSGRMYTRPKTEGDSEKN